MLPSNGFMSWLGLTACGALAACSSGSAATPAVCGSTAPAASASSPGPAPSPAPVSSGTPADAGSASTAPPGPVDITGAWLLCDAAAQAGRSDYGGGGNYIGVGGMLLGLSVKNGVASGVQIGRDGGPIYQSIGYENDAGMDCDGSCGETDVAVGGPFDPATRVWSAGFLWPHGNIPTYPMRIVFSADGTRFTGVLSAYEVEAAVYGGRDDGSFTCASGAGASGAGASVTGGACSGYLDGCGSPPSCAIGCTLDIAVVPGFPDTCKGQPTACSTFTAAQTCAQQTGCHWN